MIKPAYIFDFRETSAIDTKFLKSLGFIIESEILEYKSLQNINPCCAINSKNDNQISMSETDILIDEYLANENLMNNSTYPINHTKNSLKPTDAENPVTATNSKISNDEVNISETPVAAVKANTENLLNITVETDNKKLMEQLNSYDRIYELLTGPIVSKTKFTLFAQVLNIFDMQLQLFCQQCSLTYTICKCNHKNETRVELIAKFLIDDHTGVIKANYKNSNFNLNDKQFNLFSPISAYLLELLKIFGHLKLDSIPICQKYNETTSFSEMVSRRLSNTEHFSKNQLNFMKVVHDFLIHTFLHKYYQFQIPVNHFVISALNKFNKNCSYTLKENQETDKIFKSILCLDCKNIVSFNTAFPF